MMQLLQADLNTHWTENGGNTEHTACRIGAKCAAIAARFIGAAAAGGCTCRFCTSSALMCCVQWQLCDTSMLALWCQACTHCNLQISTINLEMS